MESATITPDPPLRKKVREAVLERLYSGTLQIGAGINETKLAEELGVSRTPLREALLTLQFEGLVASSKGKGFSVPSLTSSTARDLYLLVGWLEGAALRNEGPVTDDQIAELRGVHSELVEARDGVQGGTAESEQAIRLDMRWHEVLVGSCSNQEALSVLKLLRKRLYLYELLVGAELSDTQEMLDHHHLEVIEALEKKNPNLAVELVKHHWRTAAETRSRWLEENEPGT